MSLYKYITYVNDVLGLYIFVECALFLQSLFQQNKTDVSFREIARLFARNSLEPTAVLCLGNAHLYNKNMRASNFIWPFLLPYMGVISNPKWPLFSQFHVF